MSKPGLTGLILTGGGARAAYQVGVLQAISHIRRGAGVAQGNPFPIICGTSAGAINAAGLACRCDNFDLAVAKMVYMWRHLHAEQVYRADSFGVIRTGARWLSLFSIGWALAKWRRAKPQSLLDNSPLHESLGEMVPIARLKQLQQAGHIHALAISASSYTSGEHVTFYDTLHDIEPWSRSQRYSVRDSITLNHLLASSSIPFIFPSVELTMPTHGTPEYFGDGSMRQAAPISPAIHLGAERVLVIGAGRMQEVAGKRQVRSEYPNLAQIAGHAMSNIFLDALAVDIERLERINRTLSLMPKGAMEQSVLRPVDVLVIAPSERLDDIAARHLWALPKSIRALLRAIGVYGRGKTARGSVLASYLLFEASFTNELLALGHKDTMDRREDVCRFFGWPDPSTWDNPDAGLSSRPAHPPRAEDGASHPQRGTGVRDERKPAMVPGLAKAGDLPL